MTEKYLGIHIRRFFFLIKNPRDRKLLLDMVV